MTRLRRADAGDLARIAALARWVWLQTYADLGVTDSFARYLDDAFSLKALADRLARHPMWVIEASAPSGSPDATALQAWCELDLHGDPQRVELTRLYVAPSVQGQGLGARLLRQARAEQPGRALWLSAWEGNAGALRFYRREGALLLGETWFELDGQRHRNEVLGWPPLGEETR